MSERPRPVTPTYLERAALHYLERYTSSAENLRRVLTRKVRRRLEPGQPVTEDLAAMIAEVVERVIRSGLVDDRSYADTKVSALMRRGTSTRSIRTKLLAKGVPDETIAGVLETNEPDDLVLARRYAQRKRLGPWRREPNPELREKDLAALCRAGFSYRVASAVLDASPDLEDPERWPG
jgi:regulatory protein